MAKRVSLPPDDRREDIIQAAKKLFMQKGFEQTRMSDVAEACGISPGLSYRYFSSKLALMDEVARQLGTEYVQRMAIQEFPEGMTAREIVDLYMDELEDMVLEDPDLPFMHQEGNEWLHNRMMGYGITQLYPMILQLIHLGNRDGTLNCVTPDVTARFIINGISGTGAMSPIDYSRNAEQRREDYRALRAMILKLLGAK